MKRLLYFLPTHFTLCLIVGIVIQFFYKVWSFSFTQSITFLFLILILLLAFKQYKKQFLFTLTSWLLFVTVGMFVVFSQDVSNKKNHYSRFSVNDSLVTFQISKVLKNNLYYHKYLGSVIQVGSRKTVGNIVLNVQKENTSKQENVGAVILFQSDFVEVQKPLNPYQFNYKKYLEKQGVYHQVFLRNTSFLKSKSSINSVYKIADDIRNTIEIALIKNGFDGEELAVIKALILGQRSDISKELLQEYTKAGAIHILAVSGLHVGIILLILSFVFKPIERLKNGKVFKTIIIVFLLWSFAIIAGLSASVVRAVTMFTAVAIGMSFQRKTFVLHSLISSMFVLLLVKPMFLFDVGFQLSYLAVFSIVILQSKFEKLWNPTWKITNKFWQLFTVSVAAQIGVLPISLFYFHQFPGLFMLSNLVIIPVIGIILISGILVIILSLVNVLPSFIAQVYNFIIWCMNTFVSWISLQESFLITEISFSFTKLLLAYACLAIGIVYLEKKSYKSLTVLLVFVLAFQFNLFYEKSELGSTNEFIVFNKSRQTIIGKNMKGNLKIYHDLDAIKIRNLGLIKDYKIGAKVKEVEIERNTPNIIDFMNQRIFVIDSLGVYQVNNLKEVTVLLIQSPKINLERMIKVLKPKLIIADASNYKSQVVNWKYICDKYAIPFHYTATDGAFVLK